MFEKQKRARLQFLTWVRENHPGLYNAVMERAVRQTYEGKLAGLGEDAQPTLWSKFMDGAVKLGATYLTLKNQRDALKLNMTRAEQGLPPIDPGITAPVIRTQIDLPPDVIEKITSEAGLGLNKILLFGGAALLAFMIISKR